MCFTDFTWLISIDASIYQSVSSFRIGFNLSGHGQCVGVVPNLQSVPRAWRKRLTAGLLLSDRLAPFVLMPQEIALGGDVTGTFPSSLLVSLG